MSTAYILEVRISAVFVISVQKKYSKYLYQTWGRFSWT